MGFGKAFFFWLAKIAYDPVRPEIDHIHFQHVAGPLYRFGVVNAPRGAPKGSKLLAVEPHFGHFFDIAEVEKESLRNVI